jgi:hypothetical protein
LCEEKRAVKEGKVITTEDLGEAFLNRVSNFTLDVSVPLYWHDRLLCWPKPITGASCFVLKFEEQLVVVTAAHVFRVYETHLKRNPRLVCQLRLLPYDLPNALIDIDDDFDIATFRLSDAQLDQIPGVPVDCRLRWPPPEPECERTLSLAGFPELIREVYSDGSGMFQAYGGLQAIDAFSERQIIITYDPARDQPLMAGVPAPPIGFNMSGCSGGIVLMPEIKDGVCRLFAVGLIASGSHDIEPGEDRRTDTILIRRIHRIRPDGTLDRRPDRCLRG